MANDERSPEPDPFCNCCFSFGRVRDPCRFLRESKKNNDHDMNNGIKQWIGWFISVDKLRPLMSNTVCQRYDGT